MNINIHFDDQSIFGQIRLYVVKSGDNVDEPHEFWTIQWTANLKRLKMSENSANIYNLRNRKMSTFFSRKFKLNHFKKNISSFISKLRKLFMIHLHSESVQCDCT